MSEILHRRSVKDYLKLVVFECFGVFSSLTSFNGIKALIPTIFGKISGFIQIISNNVKKN
jgi:phage-related protein